MKPALIANVIILILLFGYSVVRDLQYQKEGAGDLRNRVVGARLTKVGKDPYFYKWKTGDSYRYLDYDNVNSDTVSSITATPLFHRFMSPLSDYEQLTIGYIWFILEYLALLIIIGAGFLLCRTRLQRMVALNTGIIFTYTHAWLFHLWVGQLYIFIAALLMLVALFLIQYGNRKAAFVIAGILTVILIFIRPTSCIILLPFVFSLKKYRWYLITTFLFSVAYLGFIAIDKNEKKQWTNYTVAMAEQVKVHQHLDHDTIKVETPPKLTYLEGADLQEQKKAALEHPFPNYSENGNVFFVYQTLAHANMPLKVLYALYLFTMLCLMVLFWKRCKVNAVDERQVWLFALALYMVIELFTPVYRHQYNTVQWLPLILLAISMSRQLTTFPYLLMFTGIILNIGRIPFIPMRHTIGEYVWLIALLWMVFIKKERKKITEANYIRKIKEAFS